MCNTRYERQQPPDGACTPSQMQDRTPVSLRSRALCTPLQLALRFHTTVAERVAQHAADACGHRVELLTVGHC